MMERINLPDTGDTRNDGIVDPEGINREDGAANPMPGDNSDGEGRATEPNPTDWTPMAQRLSWEPLAGRSRTETRGRDC